MPGVRSFLEEVNHNGRMSRGWTYATTSGHWLNGWAPVGKRAIEETFTGEGNKMAARPEGPCGDRVHHRSNTIRSSWERYLGKVRLWYLILNLLTRFFRLARYYGFQQHCAQYSQLKHRWTYCFICVLAGYHPLTKTHIWLLKSRDKAYRPNVNTSYQHWVRLLQLLKIS